jgi:hypothetical protein
MKIFKIIKKIDFTNSHNANTSLKPTRCFGWETEYIPFIDISKVRESIIRDIDIYIKNEQYKDKIAKTIINNSHDLPPDFNQIISENFWDLV